DDDSRNKIETKNRKDTLNKINGSVSAVQTNNSSTSSLSSTSSSSVMTKEKNNQSIIINNNDQKQDIVVSEQQPVNDDQKLNQSDSFTDNNNSNLDNDHHRKKQQPNKIDHTNYHHGEDVEKKSDQVQPLREKFINELLQRITKVEDQQNHDHQPPLNKDNNNNNIDGSSTTIESISCPPADNINANSVSDNLESFSSTESDHIEKQCNESGVHSAVESRCSSVNQVETSSINSIEINIYNNVNQRSNDPDNRAFSRSTSMTEVSDHHKIPEINEQKISNFRFESIKEERPVTRTRVQELLEFWNEHSLINKATEDKK
ncbi:hypothetical protein BLA29_007924, partial [Euroglyphus maynei]